MARPSFGGVPDRVRPGDWLLVQWVATAKPGDPFPEPWCHAHAPLKTMVGLLVELGVIDPPAPDADVATIARESTAAAKLWLERNPQPQQAPQHLAHQMTWGPVQAALQRSRSREAADARAAGAEAELSAAARRLAHGAQQFALRADQLQLTIVVEHHYEVQTRQREPDGVVQYRRRPVRSQSMWRLNPARPDGEGRPGRDPALDHYFVTRDHELRVSHARWETAADGAPTLRYAPTRPLDAPTRELAELLVDKMLGTLTSPQRYEQIGEFDGRSADGLAAWRAPQAEQMPAQEWTQTVLS